MFKYTDAVSFETSKSDWQVDCQKVLTSTEGTKMSFKKAMEICLSNTWLNIQSIADRDLDWKWVLNTYRWAWGLFVTAAVLAAVAAATAASACRKQIRSFNIFHHLHAKWKHFNKLQKNILPPVSFYSLIPDWPLQTFLIVGQSWPEEKHQVDFRYLSNGSRASSNAQHVLLMGQI